MVSCWSRGTFSGGSPARMFSIGESPAPLESPFDKLASVRAEAWGIQICEREGAVVINQDRPYSAPRSSPPGSLSERSALDSTFPSTTRSGSLSHAIGLPTLEESNGPQEFKSPPPSLVGTAHSTKRRTLPEPHRLLGTPELLKVGCTMHIIHQSNTHLPDPGEVSFVFW